jgi:hypothetical protein
VLGVTLVAAEELVATVAAQHHLDVARRLAREVPGRHARRVGERLVEVGDDARKVAGDGGGNVDGEIGKAQPRRGDARLLAFVERRAGERGGERAQPVEAHRGEAAGERGRVDAGRQEEPQRPVGHRAHADRRVEGRQPRLGQGLGPPVFAERELPGCEVVVQDVRGRQPGDAGQHRARRGDRPVREIRVDALGGERAGIARQPRQHRAHGRGEGEAVVAVRVDDGLQAEAVAEQVDRAPREVDDGDGEHAAQAVHEVHAPVLVGVQDELGVRAGAEAVAGRL